MASAMSDSPDISAILEGARAARSEPARARAAIAAALVLAPESRDVRMAAYKFHFYNHEHAAAADHAAVCIAMFAADLGVVADWSRMVANDADFTALERALAGCYRL